MNLAIRSESIRQPFLDLRDDILDSKQRVGGFGLEAISHIRLSPGSEDRHESECLRH